MSVQPWFPEGYNGHSPFIPGTALQIAWDSTSLGWLKTCPRLYFYHMIEGWIATDKKVHLTFGIYYHSSLEQYDHAIAAGKDHEEALDLAVKYALEVSFETIEKDGQALRRPWRSDHNLKNRETLIRSVVWYLDHFKDHPVKTILLRNGKPAVELSFKMELDWGPQSREYPYPYMLCGHIDRLIEWNNAVYVADRKSTGSTLGSYYFAQYEPDNQMSLYSIAAKIVYETPVSGVVIDAVQVAVGFSRFGRGVTYRNNQQTEEWLDNLKYWLGQAELFAAAGHWPMNDKSCGNYGGCTFRSICSKSPEVRQAFLETHFVRSRWNPLESREV